MAGSRYSLLSIALLSGLSLLSWISTYSGMLELVAASSTQVSLFAQIAIGLAVFMLQLMILYILDALFSNDLAWWLRPIYAFGYIILFIISAGFAFGFYWKYLEAGSQTTQATGATVLQVQQALQTGQSRLEQLQSTFGTLATISAQKAEVERTQGGTCPRSGPGDGPRRRLRDSDAQRFAFANEFISQRTHEVRTDIAALTGELQKLARKDPSTIDPVTATRAPFIDELERKVGLTTTRFNAIGSDPQLRQIRDELSARAAQTTFEDDRGGTFVCPDPQLQTALNGVVRSIDELPQLDTPDLRSVEGSEAVVEAFRRLTTTGIGLLTRGEFPPSPEELRAQQNIAAQPEASAAFRFDAPSPGLSQRDYIPLLIAIFVDACIFLISINRPFGPFFNLGDKMRSARRRGPMQTVFTTFYQVFQDSFGSDQRPSPLQLIAPIQDVVFDHAGEYHAAVPLDFREENYQRWLAERRALGEQIGVSAAGDIFDPRQPQSFQPLETSRFIASVFAILEGERLVELQTKRAPGLAGRVVGTGMANGVTELRTDEIRAALDKQGSVYAQADAFRLYRFKRGAWPSLLMQVVGSSAQYEEKVREKSQRRGRGLFGRTASSAPQVAAEKRPELAPPAGQGTVDRGPLRAIEGATSDRAVSDGMSEVYKSQASKARTPLPAPDGETGPDGKGGGKPSDKA